MFYTVYKTTNNINMKVYIGKHQTKNLDDGYLGSGKLLKAAIKKYGKESFSKEILFIFDNEQEMNEKEKEMVKIGANTYNLCEGGRGGFGYINSDPVLVYKRDLKLNKSKGRLAANKALLEKYGENWNSIISSFAKNLWLNDISYRNALSEKLSAAAKKRKKITGYIASDEAKQKQRESFRRNNHQKGEKNSQYGKIWITNGSENKLIKRIDFSSFIEKGFYKGRKI